MYKNNAATLNGKHTFYDYGLYVTNNNPVAPPEPKTQYIQIPGRNGDIDLTELLSGYTIYNNRIITLVLGGKKNPNHWNSFMSGFLNEIHGKKVKIVFDDDKDYYYIGRAVVKPDYARGNEIATFTVEINAEPYKYQILSTTEPWLWDPFSFVDGVIRNYTDIVVQGSLIYRIIGSEMPVIPIMEVDVPMQVEFEGKVFSLQAGKNKIYDIVLRNHEYYLTFTGNGTVSIDYRAGRL